MHTMTLLTRKPPSLTDLAEFVDSCPGGMWLDQLSSPRGIVEQDSGAISIAYDDSFRDYADQALEARAREAIVADLGCYPPVAIHLNWSLTGDSAELAKWFGRTLLAKWGGGVLDESGQYVCEGIF